MTARTLVGALTIVHILLYSSLAGVLYGDCSDLRPEEAQGNYEEVEIWGPPGSWWEEGPCEYVEVEPCAPPCGCEEEGPCEYVGVEPCAPPCGWGEEGPCEYGEVEPRSPPCGCEEEAVLYYDSPCEDLRSSLYSLSRCGLYDDDLMQYTHASTFSLDTLEECVSRDQARRYAVKLYNAWRFPKLRPAMWHFGMEVLSILLHPISHMSNTELRGAIQSFIPLGKACTKSLKAVKRSLLGDRNMPDKIREARLGAALVVASGAGKHDIIKYLLSQPLLAAPSKNMRTAILSACSLAYARGHGAIVEVLNIKCEASQPNYEKSLRLAIKFGDLNTVKFLIEQKGVNPAFESNKPIRLASIWNRLDIAEYLINQPQVDPSDEGNFSLLVACGFGYLCMVNLLLKDLRVNPSRDEILGVACRGDHGAIIRRLLCDERTDLPRLWNGVLYSALRYKTMNTIVALLSDNRVPLAAVYNFASSYNPEPLESFTRQVPQDLFQACATGNKKYLEKFNWKSLSIDLMEMLMLRTSDNPDAVKVLNECLLGALPTNLYVELMSRICSSPKVTEILDEFNLDDLSYSLLEGLIHNMRDNPHVAKIFSGFELKNLAIDLVKELILCIGSNPEVAKVFDGSLLQAWLLYLAKGVKEGPDSSYLELWELLILRIAGRPEVAGVLKGFDLKALPLDWLDNLISQSGGNPDVARLLKEVRACKLKQLKHV